MFDYFYKEVQMQDNMFCLIASLKDLSKKEKSDTGRKAICRISYQSSV